MRFRQRRFGLADIELGADPGTQAFVGQVENLLLLRQGRRDDIAVGVVQRQLDIGAHHVVLQFELGLARLRNAHVRQVDGTFAGVAFAAPQIQGIAQAQRRIVVPGVGTAQLAGTIELILRPIVALEGGVAVDLQRLGGLGNPGHRPCFTHPCDGHGHAWAALSGEVDPAIELRVAVGLPPLRGGPVGVLGGALDSFVGGQVVGVDGLALGAIPPVPMQPLIASDKAQTLRACSPLSMRVFSSLLMRRGTASEFLRW